MSLARDRGTSEREAFRVRIVPCGFRTRGTTATICLILGIVLVLIALPAAPGEAQGAQGQRGAQQATEPPQLPAVEVDVGSDAFPPVVTIVSPAQGATTTTSRPLIEVDFEDTGSGIDETSLQLILDKADVTSQAVVSPWPAETPRASGRVTYVPPVGLARGSHEVYFGVRDRAGNLAEVRWTFEVEPLFEGIEVGGRNSLKMEWYPIRKATDALDLTVQANVAGSELRMRLEARGTDYPGGTPFLSYGGYNAYLDRYSLAIRHGVSTITAGYTSVPLVSELFQVSREVRGVTAETVVRSAAGEHDVLAFYGQIASSSGLGLSVYDVAGITDRWKGKGGLVLGGTYVSLGGADGYHMLGASGQVRVGGKTSLRFEVIHGASKGASEAAGSAGSGIAAHLDVPLGAASMGFDLAMVQAGYPLPGTPASLSPERGGVLRLGLRAMGKVPANGVLNVNAALTKDNLDGSAAYTLNRTNLAATYYYPIATGWSVRASCQGELKQSDDGPRRTVDSVSGTVSLGVSGRTGLGKASGPSMSVQGTCSVALSEDRVSGEASRAEGLSVLCSAPVGSWTLSGGLDVSRKEALDEGTRTDSVTAKATVSGQIIPKVAQGTFTLFRTGSDSFEQPPAVPAQRKTERGIETTLRLTIAKSSSVNLVFKNSWWTREDTRLEQGQNRTLNLEWALMF